MRRLMLCLALAGCGDTTGSGIVGFTARAGGPADAHAGLAFDTGSGYHVVLDRAAFHLGAVYLNRSAPISGAAAEPCTLPGIYVGEAFGGVDLDLLSPELVAFPLPGEGTADPALTAEVWLTGGDVNASDDRTPILEVTGVASRAAQTWPFSATVTIGANRQLASSNPALPGARPICRQRIVTPIRVDFALSDGGTLDLRVDPRGMFHGVDFASLAAVDGSYPIPDTSAGAGGALYKGMVANSGVYAFTFTPR